MARKRKIKEPEKTGGESGTSRWMLTYLDMVTLLFGVFVLMYAMSNVDKAKSEAVAESLRQGFRGGWTIFPGPATGGQTILNNLSPAGSMRKSLYDTTRKVMRKELERNMIVVNEVEQGIRISLVSDTFFETGSDRISKEMTDMLSKIAPMLKEIDHPIIIAGHTDDVPVQLKENEDREFRDNWELAALRAINVLRFFENSGVDPAKMSAHSYGKYQPIDIRLQHTPTSTPEYRALNRRVDIIIVTGQRLNQRSE
jgi:chemotaxis protein MotB